MKTGQVWFRIFCYWVWKTSKDHCVFFCWAFFRRLSSGFLAGPSSSRMGKRPAFLYLGVASCVGSVNPRGHPMLLPDSSSTHHSLSSGRQYFRRGSICLYQGGTLSQQLFLSCIRSVSSRPDFRATDSFNYIHADMGISVPVPAFFVSRNTQKLFNSAYSEHNGCSCFSLGCQ